MVKFGGQKILFFEKQTIQLFDKAQDSKVYFCVPHKKLLLATLINVQQGWASYGAFCGLMLPDIHFSKNAFLISDLSADHIKTCTKSIGERNVPYRSVKAFKTILNLFSRHGNSFPHWVQ